MTSFSAIKSGLTLLACLCATATYADEVRLKNGDKISGRITKITADKVTLKPEYADEIEIDQSAVATLVTSSPLPLNLSSGEQIKAPLNASAQAGFVELQNSSAPQTPLPIALTSLRFDPSADEKPKAVLEGSVDTTFEFIRDGNNSRSVEIEGDVTWDVRPWKHKVEYEVNRQTEDRVQTTNDRKAEYVLDYYLSPKWFVHTNSSYQNDKVNNNSTYSYYGAGFGRTLLDTERSEWEIMVTYNSIKLASDSSKTLLNGWLVSSDFKHYLMRRKLTLFAKSDWLFPQDIPLRALTSSEVGLRYQMSKMVYLKTKYSLDAFKVRDVWNKNHALKLSIGADW
jgi:hypothetical protein